MAKLELARIHSKATGAKFAFAALFALSLLFAQSLLTTAYADKKPTYGRIKISTNPGGNPILVDGKPAGETTVNDRLLDLPPGLHTVEIVFPNGERWTHDFNVAAGRIYCIGLAYAPRSIPIPNKPLCVPYSVNVSAPSAVMEGEQITFSADIQYTGTNALNYTWTVSPPSARIVSGVGTQTIEVDTTGLGNQKVSAILVVDDGSGEPACRTTSQASAIINPHVKDKCYDCFPFTAFDDTKARLDNLAIELQNAPDSQAYIIVYAGRTSRVGQADMLAKRTMDYLVTARGIDASRIILVNGGYRDTDYFEIWICPPGAKRPEPTPTVQPGDVQPGRERTRPRRPRRRADD